MPIRLNSGSIVALFQTVCMALEAPGEILGKAPWRPSVKVTGHSVMLYPQK